jgi:hypothetical protein
VSWSVLQSVEASSATNTCAVTFGTNLSSGSKLIAYAVIAASAAFSSVKDGAGNTFVTLTTTTMTFTGSVMYVLVLDTPVGDVGTKPTITLTTSGTANGSILLVQEVSGLASGTTTTACYDGTAATANGNSSANSWTASLGAYSSTATNEYLVAVYGDDGDGAGSSTTTPSGYTADAHNAGVDTNSEVRVYYKNSTGGTESPTSLSCTSTANGGLGFATVFVAFKLAATAAVPTVESPRRRANTIIPLMLTPRKRQNADLVPPQLILPWDPPRYPQRPIPLLARRESHGVAPTGWPVPVQPPYNPASVREHLPLELPGVQEIRRRQNADLVVPLPVVTPPPFIWDAPRYPQHYLSRFPNRKHEVAPTGWPVPVQPPERMQAVRPRFTRILLFRRGNVVPTGWPVPVQPPSVPNIGIRRYSRPPWPRRGNVVPTGWPVPVQPPERMQSVRRWSRPLWPRRGVVAPTNLPDVYPFMQSERRWSRPPWPRRGNVPPTGWPVPVQPPERMQSVRRWVRPLLPRRGVTPTPVPPPVGVTPPITWFERRWSRPPWPRRGNVPPTGLPVPVQPPERMQSVRRWSRPPWPRRGVTEMPTPPPVAFNPPISWSMRRWSRPPWPRRGVVPPTGWPVLVQPPERMQSVRERLTRILLPRKGVVAPSATPPPVVLNPFVESPSKQPVRPRIRRSSTGQAPGIVPGPVPSVQRPTRFRKISGPRRVAPGIPSQPLPQFPLNPQAVRRSQRYQWFRRGNAQPNTGLPVPVQPPERMQFIRRWIKPLFPWKGVVPPSAPPPVIILEVKLPVWVWITSTIPNATITQQLPYTWIVVVIPNENAQED